VSWYQRSWQAMNDLRNKAIEDGKSGVDIARAVDAGYPWSERSGWAYKAWLDARRDFFRQHDLPLRRARKPGPDLLTPSCSA